MDLRKAPECSETLIDLVCYEIQIGRLSPEMERHFDLHLKQCAACRRRVLSFRQTLAEAETHRNFG